MIDPVREASGASVVALVAHARTVLSEPREAFASELDALPSSAGHVVVRTCHRVELYAVPAAFEGPAVEMPTGTLILRDADAVRHLISVACGIDSAVVGETQILHQLRETLAERKAALPLDPTLDRLFQAALHAGRAAHTWFTGSPRSLADVALDRIAAAVGSLEGRSILVVGAGRMGRLAGLAAARRGARVMVANRSAARGEALAREIGATGIPFCLDDAPREIDGVVVAIAGAWPVTEAQQMLLADKGVPIVDLSSPPAVPAPLRSMLAERFVSVDDLADSEAIGSERLRARLDKLISETGREYCHWLRTRAAVPAIHAVVTTAEEHRRAELDWLRRHANLAPQDLNVVEQMSHRLVAALLHAPLAALNGDASGELERAARELFGL